MVSLTTFNVLFKNQSDNFVSERSKVSSLGLGAKLNISRIYTIGQTLITEYYKKTLISKMLVNSVYTAPFHSIGPLRFTEL